jgi:hypothetical protein
MPTFILRTRLSSEAVRTHGPDVETAAKFVTLVRVYGKAQTETWAALEWDRFKETVQGLADERPHVLAEI